MKLKAPEGVGDPCVAGVIITPQDGLYDVVPEVGVLLIECFGFVAIDTIEKPSASKPARRGKASARQA
jgi:hypothetical protein